MFWVIPAVAEEKPKQVVSVNPLTLLVFGMFNVEYEKTIDDRSTWAIRGYYWDNKIGDWKWSALAAGGSYRKYFKPKAPAGGYWRTGLYFLRMSGDYTDWKRKTESASSVFLIPQGEIGHKWILKERFTIDVGANLGFFLGSLKVANVEIPIRGTAVGVKVNLGYAF